MSVINRIGLVALGMIELLVEYGARVEVRNNDGRLAIDIVAAPGRFRNDAVGALLENLARER